MMYLTVGLVTFYTMNRTRVSLIIGREESRRQADTDLLTGLMNRTAAKEDIQDHLEQTQETGVLLLLDLDRFKSVNDKLGHQTGDKVLVEVARDLGKMFRNSDVLSRLGGDEFIIYMKAVPEEAWVRRRAEEVVRVVRRWVTDGTTNIQISASVGVVMTSRMERTYEDLYRAADIAMYFAKAQGGNQAVFYSKDLVHEARGAATTREDGDAATVAEQNLR
jgi:diguanylate cyclase (GGDEF)-like protein